MMFLSLDSLLVGFIAGIAFTGTALGFVAALFAFKGADKRGLDGRHRDERHGGPVPPSPVSDPAGRALYEHYRRHGRRSA